MTQTAVPSPPARPTRDAPWSPWAWVALVVCTVTGAVLSAAAALLISFGASTTCGEPAGMGELRSGELGGLLALSIALLPWVVAFLLTTRRTRVAVGAALATSPLLVLLVLGLDQDFWVGSFCF